MIVRKNLKNRLKANERKHSLAFFLGIICLTVKDAKIFYMSSCPLRLCG
jgi:hypothetical protein